MLAFADGGVLTEWYNYNFYNYILITLQKCSVIFLFKIYLISGLS